MPNDQNANTPPFFPPLMRGGRGRGRGWALIVLLFGITIGFFLRDLFREKDVAAKVVTIRSRNLEYQVATRAETVGEMLAEQNYHNAPFTPSYLKRGEGELFHGVTLDLRQPVNITLTDGGQSREIQTLAETVGDLLNQEKIGLAPTDQVHPLLEEYIAEGTTITIDRIVDLQVAELNEIPFEIRIQHEPAAYYGEETVIEKGQTGQNKQQFLITYKNGIEVRRKLLSETILKQPVTELRSFGTKIEIEASQEGRASWYAYKRCACAAHPSFPMGRYLRVTSGESGKSVIVKINDRGPDVGIHPDRIVDLDSTVFKELAPLGAGTIGVRVELLK